MVNIISEVTKTKIYDLLKQNQRVDGRSFTEYRDIKITTDYISKANGSAMVSIGNTTVIAGVKSQVTTPFANSPNCGIIITNTELLAIASKSFEYGPPNKFAVEISRVVDRCIRESPLIDLEKLCIVESERVWKLYIDIYIIDYDGNIMDATSLATISALLTAQIPQASVVDGEVVVDEENTVKLPVKNLCCLTSIVKVNNSLLVDSTFDEEELMDASISVGFRSDGTLCAIQKCGLDSLSVSDVRNSINIAYNKSKELISILEKIR